MADTPGFSSFDVEQLEAIPKGELACRVTNPARRYSAVSSSALSRSHLLNTMRGSQFFHSAIAAIRLASGGRWVRSAKSWGGEGTPPAMWSCFLWPEAWWRIRLLLLGFKRKGHPFEPCSKGCRLLIPFQLPIRELFGLLVEADIAPIAAGGDFPQLHGFPNRAASVSCGSWW